MEIISLNIQNFMSIGHAKPISLSNRGLVLIQGENEDDTSATSNGVGKSSIADALCWALYGQTARGVTGDAVVNKIAKKDCCVSVVIEDGEVCYRISRYRKDKTNKNQTYVVVWNKGDDSTARNVEKGTERETQALIQTILGCSLEVFMAAIYAGQEVTPDLPAMTDKQLKLLIEEASGTERLENAYAIARAELNGMTTELATANMQRDSLKGQLEAIDTRITSQQVRINEFEAQRTVVADEFKTEATELGTKLRELLKQRDAVQIAALDESIATANAELLSAKPAQDAYNIALTAKNTTNLEIVRLDSAVTLLTKEATTLKSHLDEEGSCSACGQLLPEEARAKHKANYTQKLTDKLKELKAAKEALASKKVEYEAVSASCEEAKSKLVDTSAVVERKRGLEAQVAQYNEIIRALETGKTRLVALNEKQKEAMTCANPHQSGQDMLNDQRAEVVTKIEAAREQVLAIEARIEVAEAVVQVYGPAGVRAHILDTVTPFLNDRTSDYLSALSDGNITAVWTTLTTTAKGDVKEKFSIEVANEKGAESFSGLSGGEKRKVRLATMLALQDLVASRASKPIGIWIGDEVDDALDVGGLERLMGILEKKARERGTVLVISHNELKDWCDMVLTVRKVAGVSTVEGDLCEV